MFITNVLVTSWMETTFLHNSLTCGKKLQNSLIKKWTTLQLSESVRTHRNKPDCEQTMVVLNLFYIIQTSPNWEKPLSGTDWMHVLYLNILLLNGSPFVSRHNWISKLFLVSVLSFLHWKDGEMYLHLPGCQGLNATIWTTTLYTTESWGPVSAIILWINFSYKLLTKMGINWREWF